MQIVIAIIAALLAFAAGGVSAQNFLSDRTIAFDFNDMPEGKVPTGFSAALTGGGPPPVWTVMRDILSPTQRGLVAQTSADPTDNRFPVLVYDGLDAEHAQLTVRFKAARGSIDQAAGLILRYKDKDNYYVVRANALENNIRLYRVVRGQRIQFAGADARIGTGTWQKLAIKLTGDKFEVYYNDRTLFTAQDRAIIGPGKMGLWTKADSVTYFDDFSIIEWRASRP